MIPFVHRMRRGEFDEEHFREILESPWKTGSIDLIPGQTEYHFDIELLFKLSTAWHTRDLGVVIDIKQHSVGEAQLRIT